MLQQLTVSIEDSTISAKKIPAHTMDSLCARLNAAILRAKSDPETALRCAEWKKQNKEEKCSIT